MSFVIVRHTIVLLLTIATALALAIVLVSPLELLPSESSIQWNWFSRTGFLLGCITFIHACIRMHDVSNFPDIVICALIVLGGIEAAWGLGQLYGYFPSNHALYSMTGSFFNPGPYSGYLAMIFPLPLDQYLSLRMKKEKSILENVEYYVSILVLLLILCVLPAGMSRTAWIALIMSSAWVCGIHYSWGRKIENIYGQSRKKVLGGISIGFIILVVGSITVFHLKKNSAYGRLFMWKISCFAIAEKPFSGYGVNKFPMAYGMAQESYFSRGQYTSQEELVAGSPEYAFNEYLQVAMEWGIFVLIGILSLVGFCLWKGIKRKYIGVCGAIISMMIFGGASYPMQLPVFIVSFTFLLAICVIGQSKMRLAVFSFMIIAASVYWWKKDVSKECKEWVGCHILYQSGAYWDAVKRYEKLYPTLKDRAIFMYEYGHTLYQLGEYNASIERLKEAANLSCDPAILNIIGHNYQNKGEYEKAEGFYIRSSHLLPGRIYPYYLLAKLYALPQFQNKEKMKLMIDIVLAKNPKVESAIVRKIRAEIVKMKNCMN